MDGTAARPAPAPADRTTLLLDIPEVEHVLEAAARLGLARATVLRPAHVSLAHPWLPPDEAVAAIGRLDAALAGQEPLRVRFERSERFRPDGRGRTTVHLRLADPGPVQDLARTLGLALPLPHLSVIRLPVDEAVHRAEEAIACHLPLDAVVRTAQLRIRYGSWWRVEHVAHLGGGGAVPARPPARRRPG